MADWHKLHKTVEVQEPHERLVAFASEYLKPGMRVLDLGCGKGRHAIYCAQRGIETHAVDLSDIALEVLSKEAGKNQLFELLKIVKADIKELPFPDSYFDALITINVINHGYKREVERFFSEAVRVIRRGGLFYGIVTPKEFIEDNRRADTREVEDSTYVNMDVIDHDVPHHLLAPDEVKVFLAGFDIIRLENFREFSPWLKKEVTHMEIIARKR